MLLVDTFIAIMGFIGLLWLLNDILEFLLRSLRCVLPGQDYSICTKLWARPPYGYKIGALGYSWRCSAHGPCTMLLLER